MFSPKQRRVLTWWRPGSADADKQAVICDGAVRSGKTLCTGLSFFCWAMSSFQNRSFALCGKTIVSVRRNLLSELLPLLENMGFRCRQQVSRNLLQVRLGGRRNTFYLFGGKDEGSAALIQGITLAGALLDEVALMPRSFVEQTAARCSVPGSRLWFSCNPESPGHWFYREWIQKAREKNALYLHFTMEDNPSLSPAIRKRYESLYEGAFYDRFVLGKWVAASGRIYPMFSEARHVAHPPGRCEQYYLSCDYGTLNPTSAGLWGRCGGRWHRLREYYYDAREKGESRTDEEHYRALEELAGELPVTAVIVDPSAASFIECIRRHGRFRVIPAKNDVVSGIRRVSDALKEGRLLFSPSCKDTLREFSLYCWDERAAGDTPKKQNDHAMDDIRYFVSTVLAAPEDDGFFVLSASRSQKEGTHWDF